PRLNGFGTACATVDSMVPAITCPVQATYLTGRLPSEHGIVGNGWYDKDLGEVLFWKQSNRLVRGEKIWHEARRRNPAFTVANSCWWFAMNSDVDWSVTPRPLYCADGRKLPDCYTVPLELRDSLSRDLGQFPLFQFWGPATSIRASQWIGAAAMAIEERFAPTLHLVYLPHLDYCLQRLGPAGEIGTDLQEIDALCGELFDFFMNRGCRVIVLSEYGIAPVSRPVHPNRILRQAGFLSLKVDLGREYLEPYTSKTFAVADHQIAHLYVREERDIPAVKALFSRVEGIGQVWGREEQRAAGLDHERSGDLVLVAAPGSWFTYYWWQDDARAPDYARTVNIHAKPGYDPCELFIDPAISLPKARIAWTLAKKLLGFRYLMDVIPLDASLVKGSHGIIPEHPDQGPLFMTSEPRLLDSGSILATGVYPLLLDHLFRE
ncbi:MAG: alkaline phosphatase family protein, partial [Geobacter sp.]|nr:alkaline phosphatase family protein [Geobacter sp.]